MSLLHTVLTSPQPNNALLEMWKSLGTNDFLESLIQDLRTFTQSHFFRVVWNISKTQQRLALIAWRMKSKEAALTTQLLRLTAQAPRSLKQKQGKLSNVTIKATKIENQKWEGSQPSLRYAHGRASSQVLLQATDADIQSGSKPKKNHRLSMDWSSTSNYGKPRLRDSQTKLPSVKYPNGQVQAKLRVRMHQKQSSSEDVGTRLHNKAKEISKKKELLKEIYMPKYTFAPKLGPHLDWRTASNDRGNQEIIAIVSSSLSLPEDKIFV